VWFFFGYSMYRAREDRPRVGERFPEFRLPTSEGGVFDLAAERGKQHLLIFYRGAPRSTRSSPPSMRIRSSETSRPAADAQEVGVWSHSGWRRTDTTPRLVAPMTRAAPTERSSPRPRT